MCLRTTTPPPIQNILTCFKHILLCTLYIYFSIYLLFENSSGVKKKEEKKMFEQIIQNVKGIWKEFFFGSITCPKLYTIKQWIDPERF